MFVGTGFAIPALVLAFLTVGLGSVCVVVGLVMVLLDPNGAASIKVPNALNTLTLSVLVQFAGLVVLWHIPYDLRDRPVFGTQMRLFVWSFFLLASFALCVSTWWLARKPSDPATRFLRKSSILLLTIWVLGFVWYVATD
jgi:cytochrome bd-type quinol oxidase subunit 2